MNKSNTVLGIDIDYLIEHTKIWWNKNGSDKMRRRQFSNETKQQQDALDATNPVHPNYLGKSGIMTGVGWSMLSTPEKFRVMKAYTLTLKGSESYSPGGESESYSPGGESEGIDSDAITKE